MFRPTLVALISVGALLGIADIRVYRIEDGTPLQNITSSNVWKQEPVIQTTSRAPTTIVESRNHDVARAPINRIEPRKPIVQDAKIKMRSPRETQSKARVALSIVVSLVALVYLVLAFG